MEEQLKIKEYRMLLEKMHILCDKMPEIIIQRYYDSNKYLYSLYFEAFNSIKGFCVLMGNGALIPQAAAILRMAMERTATIRVLETHKELFDEYVEHRKFRFEIQDKNGKEKTELIKTHYKDEMTKEDRPVDFLEYGWFKSLGEEYGLDSLIRLSKIQEQEDVIVKWKNQLNSWVHGSLEFANLTKDIDGPIVYGHVLIDIAANLLDNLICDFHNENKFDFKFDGDDYFKGFRKAYGCVINKEG